MLSPSLFFLIVPLILLLILIGIVIIVQLQNILYALGNIEIIKK